MQKGDRSIEDVCDDRLRHVFGGVVFIKLSKISYSLSLSLYPNHVIQKSSSIDMKFKI